MRRRTVKDQISLELSIEMIECVELIVPFFGFGNFIFSYHLLHRVEWQPLLVLILGVIYAFLPMEEFSEKLFPVKAESEQLTYDEVVKEFDTDYDRENPVTKAKALSKWMDMRASISGSNKAKITALAAFANK